MVAWAQVIPSDEARRLQDQPAAPPSGVVGSSGKPLTGGRVLGYEHARHLQDRQFVADAGKMLRSSGAVMTAFRLVTSALLSPTWTTERPRGATREPEEYLAQAFGVGDWLQRGEADRPFEALVSDLLWALAFGFGVHEEEYRVDYGAERTWLRDLHYREPESIYAWLTDAEERLCGVQQVPVTGLSSAGTWTATIPASQLVVLSLMRTGANWDGLALLRPCHPHWRDADLLYRQLVIGGQRWATPTPIATVNEAELTGGGAITVDVEAERAGIAAQLKGYIGHERAYLVVPHGVKVETYGGDYDPTGVLAAIQHHERSMLGVFLAQFLALGAPGSGGTYNLAAVQERQVERSLVNVLDWIFGALNGPHRPGGGTVGRLLRWNFPGLKRAEWPRLRFEGLKTRGFLERLEGLTALAAQGLLTPTPATEARLREGLDLPPLEEGEGLAPGAPESDPTEGEQ